MNYGRRYGCRHDGQVWGAIHIVNNIKNVFFVHLRGSASRKTGTRGRMTWNMDWSHSKREGQSTTRTTPGLSFPTSLHAAANSVLQDDKSMFIARPLSAEAN